MTLTTSDIAKRLEGEVLGDANAPLTGFATLDKAGANDLTFCRDSKNTLPRRKAARRRQSSPMQAHDLDDKNADPGETSARGVFARGALELFFSEPKPAAGITSLGGGREVGPGRSCTAHIGPNCVVE